MTPRGFLACDSKVPPPGRLTQSDRSRHSGTAHHSGTGLRAPQEGPHYGTAFDPPANSGRAAAAVDSGALPVARPSGTQEQQSEGHGWFRHALRRLSEEIQRTENRVIHMMMGRALDPDFKIDENAEYQSPDQQPATIGGSAHNGSLFENAEDALGACGPPSSFPRTVESGSSRRTTRDHSSGADVALPMGSTVAASMAGSAANPVATSGAPLGVLSSLLASEQATQQDGEEKDDASNSAGTQYWLTFEVEDTGVGIAPGGLQHIFKEYVQGTDAEMSKPRTQGGTGLGLAICSKQVHFLGGRIGAHSQLQNGSTFWFQVACRRSRFCELGVCHSPLIPFPFCPGPAAPARMLLGF